MGAQGELAAGHITIAEIKRERSSEPAPAVPVPSRSGHQTNRARCPSRENLTDAIRFRGRFSDSSDVRLPRIIVSADASDTRKGD